MSFRPRRSTPCSPAYGGAASRETALPDGVVLLTVRSGLASKFSRQGFAFGVGIFSDDPGHASRIASELWVGLNELGLAGKAKERRGSLSANYTVGEAYDLVSGSPWKPGGPPPPASGRAHRPGVSTGERSPPAHAAFSLAPAPPPAQPPQG